MTSMKQWRLFTLFMVLSSSLMAKTMCSIPIEGAFGEFKDNRILNERLKKHQQIKTISFDLDIENLQNDKNNKVELIFETTQSKKFETTYNFYNKKSQLWKVDFSTSQIFPQLLKNYMNITYFNSKYYLRMYDSPSEKTIVNLVFDTSNCSQSGKSNALTRVGSR